MTLRPKIFALVFVLAVINLSAALIVLQTTTIPTFERLEAAADRKDVDRVLAGFDTLRSRLHTMAYDYALWDDTYQYFQDHNQAYLASNFIIDTFIGNSIDLVILADRQHRILWYRFADTENEVFFPPQHFNPEALVPYLADAALAYPEAPVSNSGFINTALGPMVFASYSVHRSDGTGVSPGSVLLGRFISQEDLHEIQQLVKLPFSAHAVTDQPTRIDTGVTLAQTFRNADDQIMWYIKDIHGQPLISFTIDLDPRVLDQRELATPGMLAFLVAVLSCIGIAGFLNTAVVEPLLKIRAHLQQVRIKGDYSMRLHNQGHDELGDLSSECDRLISHIQIQNQLLREQSEELEKLSLLDELTGLGNRRFLDQWLEEYWSLHKREQQPLSFLLLDIDYFKRYNDYYGHPMGDEALKRVAAAIRASLPRKTDKAARYGGEEFALLLADTDANGAAAVAAALHSAIADAEISHPKSAASKLLSISIGYATLTPGKVMTSSELVRQADIALYRAKASGRNQSCRFESDIS